MFDSSKEVNRAVVLIERLDIDRRELIEVVKSFVNLWPVSPDDLADNDSAKAQLRRQAYREACRTLRRVQL